MRYLWRNSFFGLFILCFLGCSTSSYRVVKRYERRHELKVTPDRIALQCEQIEAVDGEESMYGFMIHVLDEEKTVLSIIQGNTLPKETCFERIERLSEILSHSEFVFVTGIGDMDPRKKEERTHTFPKHGTFHDNGRVLQFMLLTNGQGACYDAYYHERKPCPRDEFPMKEI